MDRRVAGTTRFLGKCTLLSRCATNTTQNRHLYCRSKLKWIASKQRKLCFECDFQNYLWEILGSCSRRMVHKMMLLFSIIQINQGTNIDRSGLEVAFLFPCSTVSLLIYWENFLSFILHTTNDRTRFVS